MNIRYSPWGLANNYGDYVELNENLIKYPRLHDYVLKHELSHSKKFDLQKEFKMNAKYVIVLFLFCLKYPKTLRDLLPIQRKDNKWVYDLNLLILYIISAFLVFSWIKIFMWLH
jgi:hypothetical protein